MGIGNEMRIGKKFFTNRQFARAYIVRVFCVRTLRAHIVAHDCNWRTRGRMDVRPCCEKKITQNDGFNCVDQKYVVPLHRN